MVTTVLAFAITAMVLIAPPIITGNIALAADNSFAVNILTWVLRIIGALPFIPAVINTIQGLTEMQEAKAEGAGPAADKARQKLISAVALALIAVVIITSAGALAQAAINAFASNVDAFGATPTPKTK